jgi:hypothetical protein
LRLPRFLENRLIDGGEIVSLKRRPSFTPQEDSWYSFQLKAESTPGLGRKKNPITKPGIEPKTFEFKNNLRGFRIGTITFVCFMRCPVEMALGGLIYTRV